MNQNNWRKCVICNVKEHGIEKKPLFFAKFPLDETREWLRLVGNVELVSLPIEKLHTSRRICGDHFEKEAFNRKGNRIKKWAVPELNLKSPPLTDKQLSEFPQHMWDYGVTNEILHQFPHPDKNADRFRSWLYKVGGEILALDNMYIYKYRKICHLHFETRFRTRSNRLSANAVPTLCMPGKGYIETDPIFKIPNTVIKKVIKKDGGDGDELGEGTNKMVEQDAPKIIDDVADDEDPLLAHDDGSAVVEEDCKEFQACVCCLTVAGDLRDFDSHIRAAFDNLTGIESNSDDMPNSICAICIARLTKALNFKSQCIRAHEALTRAVEDSDQDWQSAILSIEREQLNLNFKLDYTVTFNAEIRRFFGDDVTPVTDLKKEENVVTAANDSQEFDDNMGESHFDQNTDDAIESNDKTPVAPVLPEDLDMTDIFKDLKDESASELESLCDFKVNPERKKVEGKGGTEVKLPDVSRGVKKYKKLANVPGGKHWMKRASHALSTANIRYMSLTEQRQTQKARLLKPSFLKALFKCAPCVKTFKDKTELIEHVGFHQRMKEYEDMCDVCKCRFESSMELDRHYMMKHWYEFECKQCTKKHRDLNRLIACYENHKKNQETVVRSSSSYSVVLDHFEKHLLSDSDRRLPLRNPELRYPCSLCSKAFNTKYKTLIHERLHQPDEKRKLKCDVCGIYLPTKRSVVVHFSANHLFLYKCRHCSADCSNCHQANAHFSLFHKTDTETETKTKKMTCNTCKAQFDDVAEYKSHMRLHWEHCSMCGHATDSLRALYYHQLTHHAHIRLGIAELNDVSVYCAECSLYFSNKEAYWTHSAEHHRRMPVDCDVGCRVCCKVYGTREELQAHKCVPQKDDHDECDYEPPAKTKKGLCAHCGVTYTNYAIHVTARHNPLLGKCKFCNQRCVSAKFMISHVLSTHTFKPYICTICNMRFFKRNHCRDHILKTHTPETPFNCKWCARRFASVDFLNQHLKNEHKNRASQKGKEIRVTQRESSKLYTFPHMRIDVTLVPSELVKQVTFYISNYAETKYTELGDGEKDQYLYVDRNIDPNVPTHDVDSQRKKSLSRAKVLRAKLLYRKRLLQFSKDAEYTRRENELAIETNNQSTEVNEGENPAVATLDGNETVHANAEKEVITKKTANYDPTPVNAETKIKVESKRVDEKMQHVGGDEAHVGEEVAHVGEVVHVSEEVMHVSEEVVHDGEGVMNVEEETVVGQLVEHDGRKYVLINGTLYEFES